MGQTNYNVLGSQAIDAVEIITNAAINKATYDKTIIGTILACTDVETGKYKIQFQDAYYYATISNSEDSYKKGDNVYILIPGNDLTREKKIIGLVENLGKGYIASSGIETQFEAAGANVITHDSVFSYMITRDNQEIELYNANNPYSENLLNIDTVAFAGFARTATKLQIFADFKTNIPIEFKRGNFGLKFELEFYKDIVGEEKTTKSFVLDTNSMIGTIYNLSDYLTQKAILDFNGAVFSKILKIAAFVNDFEPPEPEGPNQVDTLYRIFINNIGILAMIDSSSSDWNTYYLNIKTPYGKTFSTDTKELSLVAETTFKNRKVEDNKLEYYWFIRNSAVSANDNKYCEHGGRGWYCLNNYDNDNKKWIPTSSIFTIKDTDMLGASAEYKCVAVIEKIAVAFKEITIYNSEAKYYIEINSSLNGQVFYVDQGTANLTCIVKPSKDGSAIDAKLFNYYWGRLNSQEKSVDFNADNGGVPSISKTKTTKEIIILLEGLKNILSALSEDDKKQRFDKNKEEYKDYKDAITALNLGAVTYTNAEVITKISILLSGKTLSYIRDNIFYNLKGSIITEKNTFVCTVFEKDKDDPKIERYVGTGSIVIRNISSPQSVDYYTILKNHNQVFKYNQQGKSPTHRTNATPQTILPLSFEFYDKNHTKIDLTKSTSALVRWWVPKDNTLIQYIPPNGKSLDDLNQDELEKYYLINEHKLSFSIADTYDPAKINNEIFLEISYNSFYTKQTINLSFMKEGQNGTNGTDYYCRIMPNVATIEYPTVYCWQDGEEWIVRANFIGSLTTDASNANAKESEDEKTYLDAVPWFKCELWNSGTLLEPTSINWKILGNEESLLVNSPFELVSTESSPELYLTVNKTKIEDIVTNNKAPFLTVQATVLHEGKNYYATQPIALVYYPKVPTRRPKFSMTSGFNEAVYSSDGTNPQYASASPFKLEINNWGDVSIDTNNITNSDVIEWSPYGDVKLILKEESTEKKKDSKICELPTTYDGLKVNNGFLCKINSEITMFFPIHMYLNRYGHAHLNDWDGNSIKISNEEGYILTPQVGAGRKEADNTFTGMLMGEVKGGTNETDKVGLLGYGHGIQTMFLDAETGSAYFGKSGEIAIEPKGEDTEVKLGTWYLDKEAIYQSSDGTKIFGGDDPYFSASAEEAKNCYFGKKGLSLDNKLIFFNQGVEAEADDENVTVVDNIKYKKERSPGTLKIGPWTVDNTSFWKNNPNIGASNGIYLGEEGISLKDDFIFEETTETKTLTDGTTEETDIYYLTVNGKIKVIDDTTRTLEIGNEDSDVNTEEDSSEEDSSEDESIDGGPSDGDGDIVEAGKLEYNDYKLQIYNTKKTNAIGTYISPNAIRLKEEHYDSNNNLLNATYNSGYFHYIPGTTDYRETDEKGNFKAVNHFYFSRPICATSFRLAPAGIRMISYAQQKETKPPTDSLYPKDSTSFALVIGPSRDDCLSAKYNSYCRPRRTYLRGDRLILQSFGTQHSSDYRNRNKTYYGQILLYGRQTRVYSYGPKNPYTNKPWSTSSDERAKNIQSLNEKYYDFFKKLKPCAYTWKNEEDGPLNIGYSAQQVKQALFDSGLELKDFGGLTIEYDEEMDKKYGIKDFHSLSYTDFGPIQTMVLQRALDKIDELEKRIKELEK